MTNTTEQTLKIKEFYRRLGNIGLHESLVKNYLLPDWWCDEFEQEQGAIEEAAGYVESRLGNN